MDATHQISVLVADSYPLECEAVALALSHRGFRTMCAANYHDAIRILAEGGVDVLVAHGLLKGDSAPFAFVLDAAASNPVLAIVAVTSTVHADQPFSPERAHVLYKPFDLAELLAAIRAAQDLVAH
jgi:DNA-binding response OmpR family regulator